MKKKEVVAWCRGRELGVGVKRKEGAWRRGAGCRGEEERGGSLA